MQTKKGFSEMVVTVIAVAAIVVAVEAFSGLCMWGVGNLVVRVFKLNYEWTYLHGLTTSIVLSVVSNAFKNTNRKD